MLHDFHHNSGVDKQKYCSLCEESMESLVVLVHTVGINFRCGGKLDLTSEGGHLGFSKMVAVILLFSKCQRLIGLEF